MSEIVICSDFFDSFSKLPVNIQSKVSSFFDKFSENYLINGFNYEKLNKTVEGKPLYSARIDKDYRAIIYEDKKDSVFYILYVDKHNDAYHWANSRKKINLDSLNISVVNNDEYLQKGLHTKKDTNLFSRISNKDLMKCGIRESELKLIRSIPDMRTFENYKNSFDSDVYSRLELLAVGFHVRDVLEDNKYQKEQLLDFINEKVLSKAIACEGLDEKTKRSIQNTYDRLKIKKSVKEIIDFFEDALLSIEGQSIHDKLRDLDLLGFEEIAPDVRKFAI